ncbi:MAG: hypothetical protein ACRC7C_09965 [Beijerinckiaceae bacterium]
MSDDALSLRFRTRPIGPETLVRAEESRVLVQRGSRQAEIPYGEIASIRLVYAPKNVTNEGYTADVRAKGGGNAFLTNISWKGLLDVDRQDADYRAIITRIVARAAVANPDVTLMAGTPMWRFGLMAVVGAALLLSLLVLTFRALTEGSWPLALLFAAFFAYFGWWVGRYVMRNRPRRFTANALPDGLLPGVR